MGGSEGWVAELGEKVSALQFVSLVENFNCDELICQAELRQVWSTLGGREWGDWEQLLVQMNTSQKHLLVTWPNSSQASPL